MSGRSVSGRSSNRPGRAGHHPGPARRPGKKKGRGGASQRQLKDAFRHASRMAVRSSLLGALGFGLALTMGALLLDRGGLLGPGYWVEKFFFAGGICGGITFTLLATRASRAADECRRLLERRS